MSFFKIIKRTLFLTFMINTVAIVLISVGAEFLPALRNSTLHFKSILILLAFSFLAAIVSLVFYAVRLGLVWRVLIHYAALTFLLFLFVVVFGGFASGSSVILFAFLIYTVIYAAAVIIVVTVKRATSKNSQEKTENYTSQF